MNPVTFRKLLLIISMLLLSGCSGDPVKFENSVVNRSEIDLTKGRRISSSAGGFQLLLFFPININSRQERAYEALMEQAGRDLITDISVQEGWFYGFVGTIHFTYMKAMAYPKIKSSQNYN